MMQKDYFLIKGSLRPLGCVEGRKTRRQHVPQNAFVIQHAAPLSFNRLIQGFYLRENKSSFKNRINITASRFVSVSWV